MHIQLMQVFQKCSKRCPLCHLGKCVDILGEAFATVAVLAVGTRDIGVCVVDISRKKNASMHLAPVGTHLLAVFTAGVEVGDLVGTEHIVHVLGKFCLKGSHDGELLANKNLGEQVVGTGEHHGLFFEVLNMRALGKELRHIMHLVTCFTRKSLAGARQNGGTDEYWYIWEFFDEIRHKAEILRAVVFCWDVNLQESDVHLTQVVIVALGRVADEKFAFWVVVFQPVFEGSANEATSDNSNVNHCCKYLIVYKLIRLIGLLNCLIVRSKFKVCIDKALCTSNEDGFHIDT